MLCRVTVAPSVSAPAAVRFSHSTSEAQMPSSSQQQQPRHLAATVSTTRYPHTTGPQVTAASRAQLMPFILGVSHASHAFSGRNDNSSVNVSFVCKQHYRQGSYCTLETCAIWVQKDLRIFVFVA